MQERRVAEPCAVFPGDECGMAENAQSWVLGPGVEGGDTGVSDCLLQGMSLLGSCLLRRTAVRTRLNVPQVMGPKRRCLWLNYRGVVWKLVERKKQGNL